MKIPLIELLFPGTLPRRKELAVQDQLRRSQLRLLVFADELGPTVQINWLRPLKRARAACTCALWLMEEQVLEQLATTLGEKAAVRAIDSAVAQMRPDAVVACRYGGRFAGAIVDIAERRGIPLIFHIDDNLLSIPPELGPTKLRKHAAPERQRALANLLTKSTLAYISTAPVAGAIAESRNSAESSFRRADRGRR